jgi:hypothetical protein
MQNIFAATADYESWLSAQVQLNAGELAFKHDQMGARTQAFSFFRGTYYRWAQLWTKADATFREAPIVPSIGDLHIENFGTWRDLEGRLIWGVNDFDEADRLAYSNDLVRLATSIWFARNTFALAIKLGDACHCLLNGYRKCLERGGKTFVLEEDHPTLRALALNSDRDPAKFWGKLSKLLEDTAAKPPGSARAAIQSAMPDPSIVPEYRTRPQVGMGSLGKPRYLALAKWNGAWVAREAKAATAPATAWLTGRDTSGENMPDFLNRNAIRCCDPFYRPEMKWITRRLAPRCSRIDLTQLAKAREVESLLEAMGAETANIHLADRIAANAALTDVCQRKVGWLEDAAHGLGKKIEADWLAWQQGAK